MAIRVVVVTFTSGTSSCSIASLPAPYTRAISAALCYTVVKSDSYADRYSKQRVDIHIVTGALLDELYDTAVNKGDRKSLSPVPPWTEAVPFTAELILQLAISSANVIQQQVLAVFKPLSRYHFESR